MDRLAETMAERGQSYGPYQPQLDQLAGLWGQLLGTEVTAQQVAVMLAILKICRELASHQADNLIDLANYAIMAASLEPEGRHGY